MFHGINFPRLWKKGTGRSQRVEDQLCILGGVSSHIEGIAFQGGTVGGF